MILQQLRHLLLATLATSVALGSGLGLALGSTAAPAAAAAEEPEIVFYGGGFGHGIGMSQYGAYGRAQAGHGYKQILAHYYADTSLANVDGYGSFGTKDDVDVLIDVRSTVAVSTPYVNGSLQAGWRIAIVANGEQIATSTTPVTARYAYGRWSAVADGTELCTDECTGPLSMNLLSGTHVVLEQTEGGDNLGNPANGASGAYARGRIVLHPGALGGGCGNSIQFCVIHADLDLQHYLYGIAEVPSSWPIHAQRAQAVAARSYAASAIIRRAGNGNAYDLDDSTSDQYYAGYNKEAGATDWIAAVDATNNEVVVYQGEIAETYYSSSNGGHSAEPPDVWEGGTARPYLQAEPDPFDGIPANPNRARDYVYTVADVSRWLNHYHDSTTGDQLHVGTIRSIEIEAPPSGRVGFADVTIRGTKKSVTLDAQGFLLYDALRTGCLGDGPTCDAMKSTNFRVRSLINFVDVEYADYFFLPVQWMTIEEITNGVSPTRFGADEPNSRAQIATFLWRFAGEPKPREPSGFTDVVTDSFYEDAVAWMREEGITTGTSSTRYSPNGTVTRAQAATFLWRFAGSPESTAATNFTDVAKGRFYTEAVRWMVEWEITTGTTPSTFSPNAVLTRAQIATFLWRLAGVPEAFADGIDLPDAMRV